VREVSGRCHLLYALAPDGTSAREANDLLNEYVADRSRGLAVWHDHFIGEHGGTIVLEVRDEQEEARLRDPGPLEGYRDVTLDELESAETDDPRYWWRRSR
jgi:hypothetical protein